MPESSASNRIWNKIIRSQTSRFASFKIPHAHVLDANENPVNYNIPVFTPRESYFEIRINEQFLRDKRSYWHNYNPLVVTLTDFLYQTGRQDVPYVVGPNVLSKINQYAQNNSISYLNTRVAGPTPYLGDDIAVFIGLFRTKSTDWIKQTLQLLESVAESFDTTKLSTGYLSIAKSIIDGIEGILGIQQDVQFRIGQREAYTSPSPAGGNSLLPGYHVMINDSQSNINPNDFRVMNNRLYKKTANNSLVPYSDQDFILWEIRHLDTRDDYVSFDFDKQWRKTGELILSGGIHENSFREVLRLIYINSDLTETQRESLMMFYKKEYEDAVADYESSYSPKEKQLMPLKVHPLFQQKASDTDINHTLNRLERRGISNQVLNAFSRTHELIRSEHLHAAVESPAHENGPREITNDDLIEAIKSDTFKIPAEQSVDIDELYEALTMGLGEE